MKWLSKAIDALYYIGLGIFWFALMYFAFVFFGVMVD